MQGTMILSAVYSAIDKVTGPVRKMQQAVSNFEKMTQRGRGMQEWGTKVTIGAAMVGAAGDKVKNTLKEMQVPYFELEREIASLDLVIKSSAKNHQASMAAAIKAAKDWESQHGDSAASFIATTRQMSAANLKEVDAIRAARYAMGLAKGTMSDTTVVGEHLIYTYQNLGDKSKDAAEEIRKQADVTAKLQQVYQMANINEYTDAMKDAIPTAALMRQRHEEAAVAVATLQQAGWKGGMAGGSYASVLMQMEKATSDLGITVARNANGSMDFIRTVDNLTNKFGDLRKVTPEVRENLKSAFGDDGLRALMVYQQQSGSMKQAMDELKNSTGAAAAARDRMEDTSFGRMQKSIQKLDGMKVSIAEKILGNPKVLDEIIPKFISMIEGAVSLGLAFAEANPNLTSALIVLGAIGTGLLLIVAPIMSVVGGLVTMGGTMLSAFGTGLGAATKFYTFIASGSAISTAKDLVGGLSEKYSALKGVVSESIGTLKRWGIQAIQAGKSAAITAANGLKSMTLGLLGMTKNAIFAAVTALPGLIASTWAWTVALLANPMTWIVIGIMALIAAIILCIVYWDEIAAACSAAWEWIKEAAGAGMDWLKSQFDGLLDFINNIGQMFYDAGAKLWNTFADGIKSVLSAPLDTIKAALAKIDEYLPHSDARKGPLSKLTWSGSRLLTTFAEGVPKGYESLKNAVEGGLKLVQFPEDAENPNPFDIGGGKKSRAIPFFDQESHAMGIAAFKSGEGRSIIFQGPTTFKFEKVESPEDFMQQLVILAEETGA